METWLISTDPEPRIEAWQLFDSGVSMINVDAGQADQLRVIEFHGAFFRTSGRSREPAAHKQDRDKVQRRRSSRRPSEPSPQEAFSLLPFGGGTFAPFLRASDRPIAMACLRLLTGPAFPRLPERSVPRFLLRIALTTDLDAAFPYFAINHSPPFCRSAGQNTLGCCNSRLGFAKADENLGVAFHPSIEFVVRFGNLIDRDVMTYDLAGLRFSVHDQVAQVFVISLYG